MLDLNDNLRAGAQNMLMHCGGLAPGARVLVVREPVGLGYYDEGIVTGLMRAAADLGLHPTLREEPFAPSPTAPPPPLAAAMAAVDLTVFLARLGDQLRYRELPKGTRSIVSYALDAQMLASPFGRCHHEVMVALRDAVDAVVQGAQEVWITCPAGTDYRGRLMTDGPAPKDTNTLRFPLSVHTPVPAAGFSGRIAQVGFLVGTGAQYYQPYACPLDDTLFVEIEGNRLTGFTGSARDVARAEAHYREVAAKLAIAERHVHSWHAGIHPGCAFPWAARESFERWSGGAFGNPRVLHVHTCGDYAPGEISLNILDPTVTVDGVALWKDGKLCPKVVPGAEAIIAQCPDLVAAFADPAQACGQGPEGRLSFR